MLGLYWQSCDNFATTLTTQNWKISWIFMYLSKKGILGYISKSRNHNETK